MPHLASTRDHVLCIPMPWKRRGWSARADGPVCAHPKLVIGWYCEFGCFFLRLGWTL